MFGSKILEVAIGIIFIYILVSIICSAIREGIEGWFKTRAAFLEYGMRELLHDKTGTGLVKNIYNHPLIHSLFSEEYKPQQEAKRPRMIASGNNLPSYIPARSFAVAIMDIAARGPDTDLISSHPGAPVVSLQSIRSNILNINNPVVQRALLTAIDSAQGDLNKAQANIEAWYDSSMDRVSGWYKRSTQWIIFWIALISAVVLNVNTITIADYLFRNDIVREAIVAKAEGIAKDSGVLSSSYAATRAELDSLTLPIGWSHGWGSPRRGEEVGAKGFWNDFLAPVLGLLLTALAATFGAPFWFDMLNKVMVIRSTVKPHEKSPEESSEDRRSEKINVQNQMPAVVAPNNIADPINAPAPEENPPSPRDAESNLDGCDVEIVDITNDEDLPETQGGVA